MLRYDCGLCVPVDMSPRQPIKVERVSTALPFVAFLL